MSPATGLESANPAVGGPPPADQPPPLVAMTPAQLQSGPPGVLLDITGTGYPSSCETVYFFFDGDRIGSARPDASGTVRPDQLYVPGNAGEGPHDVTSSCHASGGQVVQSTSFIVQSAGVHRSALMTSLPELFHVDFSPRRVASSLLVTLGLLFLIAFPCVLFNATLEEHYDEVRGWFGFPHRVVSTLHSFRRDVTFVAFLLIGGWLSGMLSPGFGFDMSSLLLMVGTTLGLTVITIGFGLPAYLYARRRYGEKGVLQVLPGTVVLAAVCVALSRFLHIQPGYLYGLIAGFAFHHQFSKRDEGRLTALATILMLSGSLGAWLVKAPVSNAAAQPGAKWWMVVLEACLGTIFVAGLESHVFGLIPLRFLPGSKLTAWNHKVWGVLFGIGLFGFVHILLRPGSGYVADPQVSSLFTVVLIFLITSMLSVAFWAYFRFRSKRPDAEESEELALPMG